MIKRVVALVLVFALALSLMLGGASAFVSAAEKPGYKFVGALSADGKTLTLTVNISGVSGGVSAGMFVLDYDKAYLSAGSGSLTSSGVLESKKYYSADKGFIGLDWHYAETQKPSAAYTKIAEIKFSVVKSFGSLNSVLSLCNDTAYLEEIGGYHTDGGALICNGASFYSQSANALNIEYEYTGGSASTTKLVRLGGSDRFETACAIASQGWNSAETVIIVNAYSYADALAAVPLAEALNAPILLSKADSVPQSTLNKISALGAKKLVLIGGETVLTATVSSTLAKKGSVSRISGANRFETSVAIAAELKKHNSFTEAFVSYAFNYPDALSISPVAGIKGCPVLYIDKTGVLDNKTAAYIKSSGIKTATILGGTSAVSSSAEASLKAAGASSVSRIGGSSRYETSKLIALKYKSSFDTALAAVATGTDFPDALAGGVLAAKLKQPVLLVSKTSASYAADYTGGVKLTTLYIFGGTNAVSEQIAKAAA